MEKRYPRGKLSTVLDASYTAELIEIKPEGVYFYAEGSEETIFVPLSNIDRIKFEVIPEEVLNKMREEHGEVSGTDTAEDDSND